MNSDRRSIFAFISISRNLLNSRLLDFCFDLFSKEEKVFQKHNDVLDSTIDKTVTGTGAVC